VVDVQALRTGVVVLVADAQVGAFGDDVGIVRRVGEHAAGVGIEVEGGHGLGQAVGELVRAAAAELVGDDRVGAEAVEGDGILDPRQGVRPVPADEVRADAAALFCPVEYVEAGAAFADHVDHEPHAGGVVGAQAVDVLLEGGKRDPALVEGRDLEAFLVVDCVGVARPQDRFSADAAIEIAGVILLDARQAA
jgi:hypothetical protein